MRARKGKMKVEELTFLVPSEKTFGEWFAEYMRAYMVVRAWAKLKRRPIRITVPADCFSVRKDGAGEVLFYAK